MSQKVYVNHVNIRVVAEDFALLASNLNDPGAAEPYNNTTADKADLQVLMSPVMAKKLAKALERAVAEYEIAFGEIRIEPSEEAMARFRENESNGDIKVTVSTGE